MERYQIVPFFPALSSIEETGGKRGCIVLAREGAFSEKLKGMYCLSIKD
jgi:hypothetical protein